MKVLKYVLSIATIFCSTCFADEPNPNLNNSSQDIQKINDAKDNLFDALADKGIIYEDEKPGGGSDCGIW